MKRSFVSLGVLAASAFALAPSLGCQGRIAPLSAQAGSTIMIPLTGEPAPESIGYGGTLETDYQRGALVYELDGGPELVTRATGAVVVYPSADLARNPLMAGGAKRQIVSLVDIPSTTTPGTYFLNVVRRRIEGGVPVDYAGPEYNGTIRVLPNQVSFEVEGVPETITGAPTPFQAWACDPNCGFKNASTGVIQSIPKPEVRLKLSGTVWAVQLRIEYPDEVINVLDAFQPPYLYADHLATVLRDDDGAGVLRLAAVASDHPFDLLSVAFSLVDGPNEILDPGDVDVTVEGAWDEDGDPVSRSVLSLDIY